MTPKGVEDFLLRGNAVELAVVIGAAFTAVVHQFAESLLTPLVDLVGGRGRLGGALAADGQVFTGARSSASWSPSS